MAVQMIHPYVLELISSRMMHDVISPLGAINNGMELIEELGVQSGDDEALDLVKKSAIQANRRVKLFRYIYGAAGSKKNIDAIDMRQTVFSYFEGARAVLEWSESAFDLNQDLKQGSLKVLLCLIVLGGEMITKSGLIKVSSNGMMPPEIQLDVSGEGSGFREGMHAALEGTVEPEDLDARIVHAYFTGVMARYYGLKIDIKKPEENHVSFVLTAA